MRHPAGPKPSPKPNSKLGLPILLPVLGAWLATAPPVAAGGTAVTSTTTAFVVEPAGPGRARELLLPAAKVSPGDVVEYRLDSLNTTGKTTFPTLTVKTAVPPGTEYVPASAAGQGRFEARFSADGGVTYSPPPLRDNGAVVPPARYTHVQWVALDPLPPGARRQYRYRVRVLGAAPAAFAPAPAHRR